MSGRSFRSVFMVASCAGAALGCYLVSLRVASERAALEDIETKIVLAQRDIRLLQTEIGTRGRLAQLERWNVKVLALSAPSADQFLEGGFALAKLVAPREKIDLEAPVVLAAATGETPKPQVEGVQPAPDATATDSAPAKPMLHVASLKREVRPAVPKLEAGRDSEPAPRKPADKTVTAAKPAATPKAKPPAIAKASNASARGKPAATKAPTGDKAKTAATGRKASVDPLAPLSSAAKPAKLAASKDGKDVGKKQ